jgi:hypothetical protein
MKMASAFFHFFAQTGLPNFPKMASKNRNLTTPNVSHVTLMALP